MDLGEKVSIDEIVDEIFTRCVLLSSIWIKNRTSIKKLMKFKIGRLLCIICCQVTAAPSQDR